MVQYFIISEEKLGKKLEDLLLPLGWKKTQESELKSQPDWDLNSKGFKRESVV